MTQLNFVEAHAKLHDAICDLVDAVSETEDYNLHLEDEQHLINSTQQFVIGNITKFIKGGKEHNPDGDIPFVTSVDHLKEMHQEIYDFYNYLTGYIAALSRANKK